MLPNSTSETTLGCRKYNTTRWRHYFYTHSRNQPKPSGNDCEGNSEARNLTCCSCGLGDYAEPSWPSVVTRVYQRLRKDDHLIVKTPFPCDHVICEQCAESLKLHDIMELCTGCPRCDIQTYRFVWNGMSPRIGRMLGLAGLINANSTQRINIRSRNLQVAAEDIFYELAVAVKQYPFLLAWKEFSWIGRGRKYDSVKASTLLKSICMGFGANSWTLKRYELTKKVERSIRNYRSIIQAWIRSVMGVTLRDSVGTSERDVFESFVSELVFARALEITRGVPFLDKSELSEEHRFAHVL